MKILKQHFLVFWILSIHQLGAEQLYGHDILLDEHTVLFTEGSMAEIEEDGGRRWMQRFPLIHIEESDTCDILGYYPHNSHGRFPAQAEKFIQRILSDILYTGRSC